MVTIYLLVFALQIFLQVKAIRSGSKKLWLILILFEFASMVAANRIQAYFDNLRGVGFMPGLTYLEEVVFSLLASMLYGICFLISSCIFIVREEKKKKILPIFAVVSFLLLVVGIFFLGNEFIQNFDKIKCTGTIVGYNTVNVGGTEESWPLIEFTVDGKQYQDDCPFFEGAELGKEITVYASPVRATYRCILYKTSFKHIYIPAFLLSGICFLLRRKKRETVTE
ncbi:MAG: hypothetical protein IJ420_04830 [Lachnospiraceae bacterium]|nr:hypothetical protein [Lachnospiraceae bacterium]